jgi:hypothetical protein
VVREVPRYFSDEPDLSPFLKALNEVRHKATLEGGAVPMSRPSCGDRSVRGSGDGDREYFLNKPVSIGGSRKADIP